jgi:hypothetical protein
VTVKRTATSINGTRLKTATRREPLQHISRRINFPLKKKGGKSILESKIKKAARSNVVTIVTHESGRVSLAGKNGGL